MKMWLYGNERRVVFLVVDDNKNYLPIYCSLRMQRVTSGHDAPQQSHYL